jgi:murein DD-endopeptidase MepM/ murein hydrolase activator NlpD
MMPFVLALVGDRALRCVLCCTMLILSACTPKPAVQSAAMTRTIEVRAAGYALEAPEGATVQFSTDVGLAYPLLHMRFAVTDTEAYQGISILVVETDTSSVRAHAALLGEKMELPAGEALRIRRTNGGPDAERFNAELDYPAQSVLIPGPGVLYRINMQGGGVGGPSEPSPQTLMQFEALLRSFRRTGGVLQPRPVRGQAARSAQAATADVFSYPLRDADGVSYGVPVGRVLNGTRLEWLDYGIRNLDQWRIKCYGVDWSRMLHTGEDWYRLDYLTVNSAGAPVLAVADGEVVRHSPGLSYPGNVIVIRHTLPDNRVIYSMYGHVSNVSVVVGDVVARGQQIATIFNQGYTGRTPGLHPVWDSHLHFEMRWLQDAGNIYEPGTNGYNYNYPGCTWAYPGRGYTYRISPNDYPYPGAGYVDPTDFINARLAPHEFMRDASVDIAQQATETPNPSVTVTPAASATLTPTAPVTYTSWLPWVARPLPPVEPVCTNAIINGGFEASTAWVGIANTASAIYSEGVYATARAHAGVRSGRVGSLNVNGYWNEFLQTAALPTDTISATLTLWRFLDTTEKSSSVAYDVFHLGIETDEGVELVAPQRIDNTSSGRGAWIFETLPLGNIGALSPTLYARSTPGSLWITVKAATDGNNPSALYVDDVTLLVCRAQ